jgi:hypothetical protein
VKSDYDDYEVPTVVLQTAATPLNGSMNLEISWDPVPQPHDAIATPPRITSL